MMKLIIGVFGLPFQSFKKSICTFLSTKQRRSSSVGLNRTLITLDVSLFRTHYVELTKVRYNLGSNPRSYVLSTTHLHYSTRLEIHWVHQRYDMHHLHFLLHVPCSLSWSAQTHGVIPFHLMLLSQWFDLSHALSIHSCMQASSSECDIPIERTSWSVTIESWEKDDVGDLLLLFSCCY